MELPSDLPEEGPPIRSISPITSHLWRGGGGQLGPQAQAILHELAKNLGPHCSEIASTLGLGAQIRLSGLISRISGVDRSVVSRHLSDHLMGANAHIRPVANQGGRKRKLEHEQFLPLPGDLPEDDAVVDLERHLSSLFEPVSDSFNNQAPASSSSSALVPNQGGSPHGPDLQTDGGALDDNQLHGLKFALLLGSHWNCWRWTVHFSLLVPNAWCAISMH